MPGAPVLPAQGLPLGDGLSADPPLAAGCFGGAIVHDLRAVLQFAAGRGPEPSAATSTAARSGRASRRGRVGYDGHKRTRGSKAWPLIPWDTLPCVTPADEQERPGRRPVPGGAGGDRRRASVSLAYVDQGYSGEDAEVDAASDPPEVEAPRGEAGLRPACREGRGAVLLPDVAVPSPAATTSDWTTCWPACTTSRSALDAPQSCSHWSS